MVIAYFITFTFDSFNSEWKRYWKYIRPLYFVVILSIVVFQSLWAFLGALEQVTFSRLHRHLQNLNRYIFLVFLIFTSLHSAAISPTYRIISLHTASIPAATMTPVTTHQEMGLGLQMLIAQSPLDQDRHLYSAREQNSPVTPFDRLQQDVSYSWRFARVSLDSRSVTVVTVWHKES